MRIHYIFPVVALLLLPATAICNDQSKQMLVNEFVDLIGFQSTVLAQIESCKNVMKQTAQASTSHFDGADMQLSQRLRGIESSIQSLCDEIFPLEESREVYAEKISAMLSEEDLRETIRFLKSPVGQRQAAARGNAIASWQAATMSKAVPRLQAMRTQIAKEVQEAVAEFKSRTKASASK